MVNFNHQANSHSYQGAKEALEIIMPSLISPTSVLDVGCGYGFWLKAFQELYGSELQGIDGINISEEFLQFNNRNFKVVDLNQPFDLGKKFDLVLTLEVAEHLLPESEKGFIESLTKHSDLILFSAAVPNQKGDHHINCRWPEYWQNLFNSFGYECDDFPRWLIWNSETIEPWYCQNLFIAKKSAHAGNEARIKSIVHARMVDHINAIDTMYLEGKIYENGLLSKELDTFKKNNSNIFFHVKAILKALFKQN